MQDMLVPIFGENGAIIVEYAITLAVIVVLIALVVWGIRHYSGSAVRPAVRGRLPRLAIVDTLAVDNKRKLVLLRRDNVEHLVLIGGPSDIVVEPSIVRQRVAQRPGQATATRTTTAVASALPSAQPVEEPVEPAAIEPPPLVRGTDSEAHDGAAASAARRGPIVSDRTVSDRAARAYVPSRREPQRMAQATVAEPPRTHRAPPAQPDAARPEPADSYVAPSRSASAAARTPSRFLAPPAPTVPDEPPHGPVPGYEAVADEQDHDAVSAFAPRAYDQEQGAEADPSDSIGENHEIELGGAPPTADSEPPEGAAQADNVSELELEMARLLGQISTPRREPS